MKIPSEFPARSHSLTLPSAITGLHAIQYTVVMTKMVVIVIIIHPRARYRLVFIAAD